MKPTLLAIITLSLACPSLVFAEEGYVPPRANKVMFQVDKLPMDKGMRQRLSETLTTLANREHDGSANEHRLTAQLLMLAMRLDRGNKLAVGMSEHLVNGGEPQVADVQERLKAMNKLRQMITLLSKAERLSEARILEVYLKDVLVALDGNSRLADTHEENINRWAGVVPPLIKGRDLSDNASASPEVTDEEVDNGGHQGGVEVANEDDGGVNPAVAEREKKPQVFVKWTEKNSSISTPLITYARVDEHVLNYSTEVVTLNTNISPRQKNDSQLNLEIQPPSRSGSVAVFQNKIKSMIRAKFGKFESLKVKITTTKQLSTRSSHMILLPLSLQLMASERDMDIRAGLAVLGSLTNKRITRHSDFWQLLKTLRKSDAQNQRLLIPIKAAADLKQLIALEEEDFFIRYEVLLVSSLNDATDLLGVSENADINEASAEFAKIQEMVGTKSVGPFAVNKQVREKLEYILSKNPKHLSAKMILLRGEVSRSKKLDTYFVAEELSRLLKDVSYLQEKRIEDIYGPSLTEWVNRTEAVVEELEPFVDADDRVLAAYLTDIADYLATIARHKEKRDSIAVQRTMENALNHFKIKYREAKVHLERELKQLPSI